MINTPWIIITAILSIVFATNLKNPSKRMADRVLSTMGGKDSPVMIHLWVTIIQSVSVAFFSVILGAIGGIIIVFGAGIAISEMF